MDLNNWKDLDYSKLLLPELREIGKHIGLKYIQNYRKHELIEAIETARDEANNEDCSEIKFENKRKSFSNQHNRLEKMKNLIDIEEIENIEEKYEPDNSQSEKSYPLLDLNKSERFNKVTGILEVFDDGFGFIRAKKYFPSEDDAYVSPSQIHLFKVKTGDEITGYAREAKPGERYQAMIRIEEINGEEPSKCRSRIPFEDLTAVYPNERLRLEGGDKDYAMRMLDFIVPLGKGQRGMIVSPPKAGKTTLLKKTAQTISHNNPEMHIIVLLIDERPEEVTDMIRSINGEVVYSTFDEDPQNHIRMSKMALERAKRLVEAKKDVVILLDSLTRLTRAYNNVIPPSGRTLSGGLDTASFYQPKKFFGAARNMEEGGSLTILATALVDTGSRMDDVIFEEFKGTGNMEIHLNRELSELRIFPAIDIYKSGTRKEELLLLPDELEAMYQWRRVSRNRPGSELTEEFIHYIVNTKSNKELAQYILKMN